MPHPFNNILGAILGNTELMLQEIDHKHPFFENLMNVRFSVGRSREVVKKSCLRLAENRPGSLKYLRS